MGVSRLIRPAETTLDRHFAVSPFHWAEDSMRGKAPDPASPTVSFEPLSYEALNSKAALTNSAAFPNARRHAGLPPRIFRRATSITKNVHVERVVRPGAKTELSQKVHARGEIPAQKPRCPTETALNQDVNEGLEISSARKHQVTAFLISKAFAHSRDFRGTTRFLCQNLPLTLHSAGRLKPCVPLSQPARVNGRAATTPSALSCPSTAPREVCEAG